MKKKINLKKLVFLLIILLLFNELIFRFALGPSLDFKVLANENINLVEKIYVKIEKYKEINWKYPENIENMNFINNKEGGLWAKYGFYKLINNSDYIIWIKIINSKYVNKYKIKWLLYKDIYYKSSRILNEKEIENYFFQQL